MLYPGEVCKGVEQQVPFENHLQRKGLEEKAALKEGLLRDSPLNTVSVFLSDNVGETLREMSD